MATSKEVIRKFAEEASISQKSAKVYADALESALKSVISEAPVDERFKCLDLNFTKKDVAERTCRNPQTGENMEVPATTRMSIKPSVEIKQLAKN